MLDTKDLDSYYPGYDFWLDRMDKANRNEDDSNIDEIIDEEKLEREESD